MLFGLLIACAEPPSPQVAPAPESASRMVAAAHPAAVQVGNRILDQGGTALDAAVAVQMVLGFVEAPESGLGGGGFLLYHDQASNSLYSYDGRETAPAAARPYRFTVLGQAQPLWSAIPAGQAVGVPGLVRMLALAHEDHGTLPWAELLTPAAELADTGLPMPPRLQAQIAADPSLRLFRDTRRYFVRQANSSEPYLHNPELAGTLRQLASGGPDTLYTGALAEAIIERARARVPGSSDLQPQDLAQYAAERRQPLCLPYRDYRVCSAGPPTGGGIAVLQTLYLLEPYDLAALRDDPVRAVHLIAEASRLALADRDRWVGDPDQAVVPVDTLLDADYLGTRAGLLNPLQAASEVSPGQPLDTVSGSPNGPGISRDAMAWTPPRPGGGTTHFTVVDDAGNLAALTSSNEMPFGTRMMVGGFLLNNQLTDFHFQPRVDGEMHPNAVASGKRPASAMTPVMVFDQDDQPILALGSRGGGRIPGYVTQVLIEVLDWERDIATAIAQPRFLHTGHELELEADTAAATWGPALTELGHRVAVRPLTSGLHGVQRTESGWLGGADPRLDGMAAGQVLPAGLVEGLTPPLEAP